MFGPYDLLNLYRHGVFPMADSAEDTKLAVIDPEYRGIIPIDGFHIPRRLKRQFDHHQYRVTADTAFRRVIELCGEYFPTRRETWINEPIISLYSSLNTLGYAHSIELWEGDELVGGLYGVHLGSIFFGESMFSRQTNTSKFALIHLVAALKYAGFTLLDAQFYNPHLVQFGLYEIPRQLFQKELLLGLRGSAKFPIEKFGNSEISQLPTQNLPHFQPEISQQAFSQEVPLACLSSPSYCLTLL